MKKSKRIILILTEDCNLRCTYCYVPKNPSTMGIDVIDGSIAYIKGLVSEGFHVQVELFGGEPTLCMESILYIAEALHCMQENVSVTIFTNATLLTREFLEKCRSFSYIGFNLSLDGCKKAHDACRVYADGRGSFDHTMEGIRLYSEVYRRPLSKLSFGCVISPHNVGYLSDTARWAVDNGINSISFSLDRSSSWTATDVSVYETEINELADLFIANFDKGLSFGVLALPIVGKNNGLRITFCSVGNDILAIAPNGDLYPCQRMYSNRSEYKMGTVFTGVTNRVASNLFSGLNVYTMLGCSSCSNLAYCPGQCVACMHENNNILVPIEPVCQIHKINTKVALRVQEQLKDNPRYASFINPNKYRG